MLALFIVMGPGFNEYFINSCTVVYSLGLQLAVCVLPQLAISEHVTVNLQKSLMNHLAYMLHATTN
jgi:hypothetical protein